MVSSHPMPSPRWTRRITVTVTLALMVALGLAPLSAGTHPTRQSRNHLPPFNPLLPRSLYADFDGDNQPDEVELDSLGAHRSIRIRFGNSWRSTLYFDTGSDPQGVLLSRDIDHDSDLDLIWMPPGQPQAAVVWLGDGRGNFERAKNLEAYAGKLGALIGESTDSGVSNGSPGDDSPYASVPSTSCGLAPSNRVEITAQSHLAAPRHHRRRGLMLCLAYLRERGPPTLLS